MSLRVFLAVALVAAMSTPVVADKKSESKDEMVHWGFGVKARQWRLSKRVQKMFVEDSPGPATDKGAGVDLIRRRGGLEFSFGFGFDRLTLKDGYYVEKGGDPLRAGDTDYIEFDQFAWITAEVSVANNWAIHPNLALRMGGGIGVAWLLGEMRKTDALCTGPRAQQDCMLDPNAVDRDTPAEIPPILPVVNVFVGAQVRPFSFLAINIDVGLHSTPYLGVGAAIYFR